MTKAEKTRLEERGLTGVRLSCQIVCDHDMTVRAISRLAGSGRPDPGKTPEPTIQPPPEVDFWSRTFQGPRSRTLILVSRPPSVLLRGGATVVSD